MYLLFSLGHYQTYRMIDLKFSFVYFRISSEDGAVNVSEGIGNPVYDEDRPLEGVSFLLITIFHGIVAFYGKN